MTGFKYSPSPPREVVELIRSGLLDPDADVRLSAISAAAARAAAPRFVRDPAILEISKSERPQLLELRPIVLKLLNDTTPRIRLDAIIALVNFEYDPASSEKTVRLGDDAVAILMQRFKAETDAPIRTEIAKTFALGRPNPVTASWFVEALDNKQPQVVSYAVLSVRQNRPPDVLPRIVALLKHPHPNVRLQVGQTLAAYGPAAASYVGEIEAALEREQEDAVRKTLEGTLQVLRRR